MQMMVYIFIIVISFSETRAYRHTLFPDNPPLCSNITCTGGVQHTVCKKFEPHKRCVRFSMLSMQGISIKTMLLGHNGIRNKIAKDWDIGNMHVLHWSRELQMMSAFYLTNCLAEKDVCDFLVSKDITVGHNFFYSTVPPSTRWAGRAVRKWYSELGYTIKKWEAYKAARDGNVSLDSFTQMIWPTTEFVGCAGARMFNGYLATCYYHPIVEPGWQRFELGKACTKCPDTRPTCSRFFSKLCGLDLEYGSAGIPSKIEAPIIICILLTHYSLFNLFSMHLCYLKVKIT